MIRRIKQAIRRFAREEEASSTIEFVIIFTPLIMLIFLILQVSIAYHWALSAQKGLEMAARMAAVRAPVATDLVVETGLGTRPVNREPLVGFEAGDACYQVATGSSACEAVNLVTCTGATIASAAPDATEIDGCNIARFMELYNEVDRFAYNLELDDFAIAYEDVNLGNAGQPYVPLIVLAIDPQSMPVVLTFFRRSETVEWDTAPDGNERYQTVAQEGGETAVQLEIPQIMATIVAEDLGI